MGKKTSHATDPLNIWKLCNFELHQFSSLRCREINNIGAHLGILSLKLLIPPPLLALPSTQTRKRLSRWYSTYCKIMLNSLSLRVFTVKEAYAADPFSSPLDPRENFSQYWSHKHWEVETNEIPTSIRHDLDAWMSIVQCTIQAAPHKFETCRLLVHSCFSWS